MSDGELVTECQEHREIREYARHKQDCALSRVLVPSFGSLHRRYFEHCGGQCAEKREIPPGEANGIAWGQHWALCQLPAGHAGPHRGSVPAGSGMSSEWHGGTCTCGLTAVLAALDSSRAAQS